MPPTSRKKDTSKTQPQTEDVAPQEPAGSADEAQPIAQELSTELEEAASIEARIADLERELEMERAQALRVLADFQNYRRRSEEQRAEIVSRAVQDFVVELLPILDNFERALAASGETPSYDGLVSGVELILRQLRELLKRHGIEPIEAVGQPFDPNLHDAVVRVEDADAPENTVVEELQRGYLMRGRVLRPAMVKVASGS